MKQKELKQIIEKYPEISSISVTCKKFPKWVKFSAILPHDDLTCQLIYINKINIFFHLEEKNDQKPI